MRRILICTVIFFFFFGAALSQSNNCSGNTAKTAEENIDQISTWPQAILFYQKYHNCLISGGISYGYDNKLAELLAEPEGLTNRWSSTDKQLWFRKVIAKRVVGESNSLETSESILKNLNSKCPFSGSDFCKNLRCEIKKICQACR